MSDATPSRMDVLSAAYDDLAAAPETSATPVPEAGESIATAPPAPQDSAPTTGSDRPRDESGRFVKTSEIGTQEAAPVEIGKSTATPKGAQKADAGKAAAVDPGKVDGAAPPSVPSTDPVAVAVKPPQAWSPQAREAFAKAPPEVQREVDKREREITRALNETAQARQVADTVHRTLAPFEGLARSQGMDAMSYAGTVMQTAAALHMGTPAQKAAIVAQLIGTYGIDVEHVNAAMQNPQAVQPQQPQRPAFDPREEVRRAIEEERTLSKAREFLASPPEFWDTVQAEVLDMIRVDRARGGNMTPQQAYERVCRYNDEVQGVLSQRKASEDAQKKAAEVGAARVAAGSVRSTPAPGAQAKPANRRDALEQWSGWTGRD
jgi:hypothetical protein